MAFDFSAAVEQAAAEGPDYNEAVGGGGGDREPPAAGLTRLRLISYIELGEHMDGPKGQEKRKPLAKFVFELSGPKHTPKELDDGRKIPHTINFTLNVSQNEKSRYYKLFKRMNWSGKHKIFPQMLGEDFLGTVVHKKSADGTKTYANLHDDSGYTVRSPFVEDPETGESRRVAADPPLNQIRCLIWSHPTQEMWDSIFIDGMYDEKRDEAGNVTQEGRSKNFYQNFIRTALNFDGSPVCNLIAGGDALNLPEATKPERKADGEGNPVGDAAKPSPDKPAASPATAPPAPSNDEDPLAAVA